MAGREWALNVHGCAGEASAHFELFLTRCLHPFGMFCLPLF